MDSFEEHAHNRLANRGKREFLVSFGAASGGLCASVGRLSNHFRIFSNAANTGAAEARLRRVTHEQFAGALDQTLDSALGNDPSVYVLRTARVRVSCNLDMSSDADLARRWSRAATAAILRQIHNPRESGNVVRFENRAEYTAHFITDLLRGEAADRWYYSPFESLRQMSVPSALATLLGSDRELLPVLLAALERLDSLKALLQTIDPGVLSEIWSRRREEPAGLEPAALRYLFEVALAIGERLGLSRLESRRGLESRGRISPPRALQPRAAAQPSTFRAAQPTNSNGPGGSSLGDRVPRPCDADLTVKELVAEYRAQQVTAADWCDSASLAGAIAAILDFLLRRGLIEAPRDNLAVSQRELEDRLRDFDWLDLPYLAARILDLLRARGEDRPQSLPARPPAGLTPRQRLLVEHMLSVLKDHPPEQRASAAHAAADAVRIYAWLVGRFEPWSGDVLAESFCTQLAAAVQGEARACRTIAALGEHGSRLLSEAARVLGAAPAFNARAGLTEEWVETRAAGIFLLARAVLDVHLQRAAAEAYPPSMWSHLLGAVALRWAGEDSGSDALDPGIALFSGLDVAVRPSNLAQAWTQMEPAAHHCFQAALFRELAAHRMFSGSALHLYRSGAVIGGGPGVWCFGRLEHEQAEINTGWRALWDNGYGTLPETIEHERDDALRAAFEALAMGQLGAPFADLTFMLAASSMLRLWARWLPRFSSSSIPYLLRNFVRRPGRIRTTDDLLFVELEPLPLDVVLEMSGYTAITPAVPWLDGRRIGFAIRGH